MTQYTTSSHQANLARAIDRSIVFEPAEREKKPFYMDIKEAKGLENRGTGVYFRIVGSLGPGVGNPDEGGDYSTAGAHTAVECVVTGCPIDSVIDVSQEFIDASEGEGSYAINADAERIALAARRLLQYADMLMGAGDATGALAYNEGAVSTSATVPLRWPEGGFKLRVGHVYDIVTSAHGIEGSAVTVLDIDYKTPQCTVSTTVNLTDDSGFYVTGQFGNRFPNGVLNIVDDGDIAATLYGATRNSTTNTMLNAFVDDGSGVGGADEFSEASLDSTLDQLTLRQDFVPTQLRSNKGMAAAFKKILTADRTFTLNGQQTPGGTGGLNNEGLAFVYGETKIPWKVDGNLPARAVYGLYWPGFRKHTRHKPDWFREQGGPIFDKKIAATAANSYAYAWVGSMFMDVQISHSKPSANFVRKNYRDPNVTADA